MICVPPYSIKSDVRLYDVSAARIMMSIPLKIMKRTKHIDNNISVLLIMDKLFKTITAALFYNSVIMF